GHVRDGTVSRLAVSGEVAASRTRGAVDAGGIVGYLHNGTISGCSFTGTVELESHMPPSPSVLPSYVGGIAGQVRRSTVKDCAVFGATISMTSDRVPAEVGGIAGSVVGSTVTGCVVASDVAVSATNSSVTMGSVFGRIVSSTISGNVYHCAMPRGIGGIDAPGAAKAAGPSIVTPVLPGGTGGAWWRRVLIAAPSDGVFAWSAKGLPKGLSLDKKTGILSGIPEKTGTYTIEVTVTSEGQTATRSYQIVIAKPGRFAIEGEDDLPGALVGQSYSHALTTTGGRAASWRIEDGDLGKGMKFSEKTGKISGTPKKAGDYPFVVTAEKADGTTASRRLTLRVLEGVGPAAPEGLVATPPTARGLSDGTISGVDAGMEWSADGGETWTDCPTSGPITGLAPGAYLVRVKETATTKAGESATVTVPESGAHVVEIRLTDGGDGGPAVVLELTSNGEPVAGMDLWAWLVPTDGGAEQGAFLGTTDEAGRLVIDVDALVWATGDRAGEKASIPAGTWRIRIEIRDASGDLWTGVSSDAVSLPATSPIGSSGGCGNVGFGALAMIACASLILRRRS
ncbi:MAG: putative Ig domain-containing protein, partial [Synergistaceae bacterium]|nr:putative Ig domain-containing protein [Synergistaceae bacterium]